MSPGGSEGSEATTTPEGETDFRAAEGAALGDQGAGTRDLTQGRLLNKTQYFRLRLYDSDFNALSVPLVLSLRSLGAL